VCRRSLIARCGIEAECNVPFAVREQDSRKSRAAAMLRNRSVRAETWAGTNRNPILANEHLGNLLRGNKGRAERPLLIYHSSPMLASPIRFLMLIIHVNAASPVAVAARGRVGLMFWSADRRGHCSRRGGQCVHTYVSGASMRPKTDRKRIRDAAATFRLAPAPIWSRITRTRRLP